MKKGNIVYTRKQVAKATNNQDPKSVSVTWHLDSTVIPEENDESTCDNFRCYINHYQDESTITSLFDKFSQSKQSLLIQTYSNTAFHYLNRNKLLLSSSLTELSVHFGMCHSLDNKGILNISEAIRSLENLKKLSIAMDSFRSLDSLPLPTKYLKLSELNLSLINGWGLQIRMMTNLFQYVSKAQNLTKFSLTLDHLELDTRKELNLVPFFQNLQEFTLEFKGYYRLF
eukprot:TRINITY_DN6314_c0_g2_i1.p1 TRINITY_DN6314_c0_g2~~TRINITY_DN6314_c0_g2_i1.p1  ORF type:complete len:228 (+),score=10.33 TRINITY_DN6314_c0_g2_i1:177-860(+)